MSNRAVASSAEPEDDQPEKKTRKEQSTGGNVDPEVRKLANEMLANPEMTRTAICAALRMDHRTLNAICAEDMPEIAQARVRIARLAYESTVYNLAAAANNAKNGKGSALEAKLSWDVYMGAMGEASSIVQHEHLWPQLNEYSGSKAIEGVIVDVEQA